jgi:hypothetical protein
LLRKEFRVKATPIAVFILLTVAMVSCGGNPAGPPAAAITSTPGTSISTSAPSQSPAVLLAGGPVNAEALDTAIRLHWQAVPAAQGYLIYRDGNSVPLNTTPIPDTTYEDVGLSNGRPYRYGIVAVDGAGHSVSHFTEITVTATAP